MVEETNSTAAAAANLKTHDGCIAKDTSVDGLDEFDCKHGIIDSGTPKETQLCGRYKKSFAYFTFRHRLPNTLSVLLNNLSESLKANKDTESDVILVSDSIRVLKTQLENNGPFENLSGNEPDVGIWNDFIASLPRCQRSFFNTCWLYSECYLYRKIYSIFRASNNLKSYDYFSVQKLNALTVSSRAMDQIIKNLKDVNNDEKSFIHILKLNLWGNRCDLSISSGQEVKPEEALFEQIDHLNCNILIDDSAHIWRSLNKNDTPSKIVDMVCDNAGFELFTDLLLANFLVEQNLADIVQFHVKSMPWFVSDTTAQDIECTLNHLKAHELESLVKFGKKCSQYFDKGVFKVVDKEYFWTTHFEYYRMKDVNPTLYQQLQKSALIIFKGDLNYRKLLGDFNWDFTECYQKCLRGFKPASLCSLRTVKGDLICGLKAGLAENLSSQNKDWMFTGEYGTIQFLE